MRVSGLQAPLTASLALLPLHLTPPGADLTGLGSHQA